MFKKIVFSLIALFFTVSCSDTWSSVKRGLTGAKSNSTDEFLVEKKDPLVLPPNFENLLEIVGTAIFTPYRLPYVAV